MESVNIKTVHLSLRFLGDYLSRQIPCCRIFTSPLPPPLQHPAFTKHIYFLHGGVPLRPALYGITLRPVFNVNRN